MEDTIEKLKLQHFETYKSAILESVKNNTSVLTDEDITSLLKKPPLDSMDSIKSRFLTMAKKNKIILDTESLSKILDEYRENLIKCTKKIKKLRIDELSSIINKFDNSKEDVIIKLLKKDFNNINKNIKKIVKEQFNISNEKFIKKINTVFLDDTDLDIKNKIISDITKFVNSSYQKQTFENIDIKILIKDTTLINVVKEQTERYLFTLNNSRLFKDNI